jgi:hypothetical protein
MHWNSIKPAQPSVLFVIKYYIKIMEHWNKNVGAVCLFLYFLVIFMVKLRLRLWLAMQGSMKLFM